MPSTDPFYLVKDDMQASVSLAIHLRARPTPSKNNKRITLRNWIHLTSTKSSCSDAKEVGQASRASVNI
jgi:hypothetical protein